MSDLATAAAVTAATMKVFGDRNLLGLIVSELLSFREKDDVTNGAPLATLSALSRVCLRLHEILANHPDLVCARESYTDAHVVRHIDTFEQRGARWVNPNAEYKKKCVCACIVRSYTTCIIPQFTHAECRAFQRYHYAFSVRGSFAVASFYLSRAMKYPNLPVCPMPRWYPLSLGHVQLFNMILKTGSHCQPNPEPSTRLLIAAHLLSGTEIPPSFTAPEVYSGIMEFLKTVCRLKYDASCSWASEKQKYVDDPRFDNWLGGAQWTLKFHRVAWEDNMRFQLIGGDAREHLERIDTILKQRVKRDYLLSRTIIGIMCERTCDDGMLQRVIVQQVVAKFGWVTPQKFIDRFDRVAREWDYNKYPYLYSRFIAALETLESQIVMPAFSRGFLEGAIRSRARREANEHTLKRVRANESEYTFFPVDDK